MLANQPILAVEVVFNLNNEDWQYPSYTQFRLTSSYHFPLDSKDDFRRNDTEFWLNRVNLSWTLKQHLAKKPRLNTLRQWSLCYFSMFHFIVVETVRRISIFLDIEGFPYPNLVAAVFTFPLMCWKPLVISPIVFSCVLYGCLKHFKILRAKVYIFVINALSFYRSQNVLCQSEFFEPAQKFECI